MVDSNLKVPKDFGVFTIKQLNILMTIAKESVEAAVNDRFLEHVPPDDATLLEPGAAFVTLKKHGNLRGCIGHVLARIPLYMCISEMARSAAVHDSRFAPVSLSELVDIAYEISILTKPEPIDPDDIKVGRDGLIISQGVYSGLLLPQVPVEWGWNREQFLIQTCRKAGLSGSAWQDSDVKLEAFRAIVFDENDI